MSFPHYKAIFFAANGFGPYTCCFCGDPVAFEEVHVHHVDEDHYNDERENLAATHSTCHLRHHGKRVGKMPALQLENETRDRTPMMCTCGAGPFAGPTGLKTHRTWKGCE